MTDRDRRALTDLATGNLPSWRALWLQKRLVREPELASEWEKTQVLFQKLRQESLPESVPEPPKWPAPQHAPKERFAVVKTPVVLIAVGFAAFLGVTFVSVYQAKRDNDRDRDKKEQAKMFYLIQQDSWLFNPSVNPPPTPLNSVTKNRQVTEIGLVADTNVFLRTTWRAFGDVRVKARYSDGTSVTLTARKPESSIVLTWLKRHRPNYPEAKGAPRISWSRGRSDGGKLFRNWLRLRREDDSFIQEAVGVSNFDWLELEDAGRFEGFGTHQIKDKDGKVLVTLLVEPLSVQSKHDSESSQRRAKDPVRP